jgi:hypothetical protein
MSPEAVRAYDRSRETRPSSFPPLVDDNLSSLFMVHWRLGG